MADIEANGIHVDVQYINKAIRRSQRRIEHKKRALQKTDVYRQWRRTFGSRMKLGAREQMSTVLFDVMGVPAPAARTASGKVKMDEAVLNTVDHPFVQQWLAIEKLKKAMSTYLKGLLVETVDGYMHPFFNLHTTQTYRSSSDSPNFQNIPVRDPVIGKLIRTAIIPRPGRCIVESDISGAEVRTSSNYNKDPRLIKYILDPSSDMHRDMACECYMLEQSEVTKRTRAAAKSYFVFAQFYGDWYIDCARRLWEGIHTDKLTTASGVPLDVHLRKKGITRLGRLDPKAEPIPGSMEGHIRKVERDFWHKRFPVYHQWKQDWYDAYRKQGWFETLTGFVCSGYMKRNEAVNYPIQGSAFHCLLWCLIRLQNEMKRRKMETLVVGQIHDSIVADVVPSEMDEYTGLVVDIVTRQLQKHWDWIEVPMAIDIEASGVDRPWVEKKEVSVA